VAASSVLGSLNPLPGGATALINQAVENTSQRGVAVLFLARELQSRERRFFSKNFGSIDTKDAKLKHRASRKQSTGEKIKKWEK